MGKLCNFALDLHKFVADSLLFGEKQDQIDILAAIAYRGSILYDDNIGHVRNYLVWGYDSVLGDAYDIPPYSDYDSLTLKQLQTLGGLVPPEQWIYEAKFMVAVDFTHHVIEFIDNYRPKL